jgi:tetratricopeptide (TPR) repeat protein
MMTEHVLIAHARALYRREQTPANSLLIRQALADAVAVADEQATLAELKALQGHSLVCDYLNEWNDVGKDQVAEAEILVRDAMKIIPDHYLVHYINGYIERARPNHQASLEAFAKALSLKSDFALAHAQVAQQLTSTGRPTDALPYIQGALSLRPNSISTGAFYWIMGRAYFFMGRYNRAIQSLKTSIEMKQWFWYNRLYVISAHMLVGERVTAIQLLSEFNREFSGFSLTKLIARNNVTYPEQYPVVVEGLNNFHKGLAAAGLPE